MTKRKVIVEYLYSKIVEVEATDDGDAFDKVAAMIQDHDSITMDESNFQQFEIFVIKEANNA